MSRMVLITTLALVVLAGCATHSQKIKGNQVHLYLKDTSGREVLFASSLDGFQHHPLTKGTGKTWFISLPSGHEFTYFYIRDGQPFLPGCPYKEQDGFGSENCIFVPDL